jgi:hypothetical protein
MTLRSYFTIAKIIFIVITPVILLILPADFFDGGKSICLSQLLFNAECYACGLTRGIMHLIHFEFEKAYEYHMLSFVVLPLLGVVWVQWLMKEIKLHKRYRAALAE